MILALTLPTTSSTTDAMDVLGSVPPAFQWPVQFCIFSTVATYVASIITSNVSQVDRLWTFLPTIYTAYFALLPLWPQKQPFYLVPYTPASLGIPPGTYNPRALMMLALIVTWMFRLSYNTYRRGLFNLKDEDYRWLVLRQQMHPILFQIFNLGFISFIQNVLLLALGIPAYIAASQPPQPLENRDYFVIFLSLLILVLEFTSDNQQYAYQAFKHEPRRFHTTHQWIGSRLQWVPADAERGFVTRGLWAWSRHPNFACEQSFWWIMNIASLPSSQLLSITNLRTSAFVAGKFDLGSLLTAIAPLTPAVALSILFFSSTLYTEAITASKYPAYTAYRARVGMFSPLATAGKGLWLAITGGRVEVERTVWGKEAKDE
ncbi:hypothetical protein R3P38DRAFT_2919702 [Favolaschia claudopus]|uniref:DUF1295-domain-containing protein n=1 Tax=Favolaschia claudopus TaxID=2862362 RepID=A0AAW0C2C3_9AGAR